MYFAHLSRVVAAILFLALQYNAAAIDVTMEVSSKLGYRLLESNMNPNQPNKKASSLHECTELCSQTPGCKSSNYNLMNGDCELNQKQHYSDEKSLVEDQRFIYYVNPDPKEKPKPKPKKMEYKTCARLKEANSSLPSGNYELDVNGKTKSVYCDMDKFGGGWSLVVSISRSNKNHLLRRENNCYNSSLCVPLTKGTLVSRKLSDEDIRAVASYEGTFRIDVISTTTYTGFFRLSQGAQVFDSGCTTVGCPRIIASHVYPYVWESNCKGIEKGYQIYQSGTCYAVFDHHDNRECGSKFSTSKYYTQRILYNYCTSNGLYRGLQGNMYVR